MTKYVFRNSYQLRAYLSKAQQYRTSNLVHLGKWRIEGQYKLKYWLTKNNIDRLW